MLNLRDRLTDLLCRVPTYDQVADILLADKTYVVNIGTHSVLVDLDKVWLADNRSGNFDPLTEDLVRAMHTITALGKPGERYSPPPEVARHNVPQLRIGFAAARRLTQVLAVRADLMREDPRL